jgi:hypothetical protein
MRRGPGVAAVLVGCGAMLAARAVGAQAGDATGLAEALFREGRREAIAGDYAAACAKFTASQRLDPSTGTLLNLGDCEAHQGHMLSGRNYYQTALAQLGGSDPRVPHARARLTELDARLPRLTIVPPASCPPGTVIMRDGAPVPPVGLGVATPVDPGEHVIVVAAPRRAEVRQTIVLAETQSRELVVLLGPEEPVDASTARDASAQPRTSAPSPPRMATARTLGWISVGVAIAGIALAGASGFVLIHDKSTVDDPNHCNARRECDSAGLAAAASARTWLVVNTASWVTSLVGVAAGAYLLISSAPGPGPRVEVDLVPLAGGAEVAARGRF